MHRERTRHLILIMLAALLLVLSDFPPAVFWALLRRRAQGSRQFCGSNPANMGILVFADPSAQFDTWLQNQAQPAGARWSGIRCLSSCWCQFVSLVRTMDSPYLCRCDLCADICTDRLRPSLGDWVWVANIFFSSLRCAGYSSRLVTHTPSGHRTPTACTLTVKGYILKTARHVTNWIAHAGRICIRNLRVS